METDSARPKIQTIEVPAKSREIPTYDHPKPLVLVRGRKNYFKNIVFVIPALLLIVTILVVGYGINWYISLVSRPTPVPTPMPTLVPATPVPTPKLLQNKTYMNLDLGFSFKYTENLSLLECKNAIYLYDESFSQNVTPDCASQDFYRLSIEFGRNDFYPAIPKSQDYEIKEVTIFVGGEKAIRQEIIDSEKKVFLVAATFSKDSSYFLIKTDNEEGLREFEKIISNFNFVIDTTLDWIEYSNSYYSLEYPPDWILSTNNSGEGVSKISKSSDEQKLHTIILDFSKNVAKADLTASEVISSTRSLSGWLSPPSLDFRNIGGGTAQILQGHLEGNWHTFVVIWYKNRLIQISWYDDAQRSEQEVFDNILSSFRFKN